LRPFTRTSFHHQPEAQHPKSSAIHKLAADYPIYYDPSLFERTYDWMRARGLTEGQSEHARLVVG
jgi:hypothetical protein